MTLGILVLPAVLFVIDIGIIISLNVFIVNCLVYIATENVIHVTIIVVYVICIGICDIDRQNCNNESSLQKKDRLLNILSHKPSNN
ncbi:MAG: hypothetical protein A2W90_14945 [Bacteroidetes bacterium GWF2_42_66]|nr:MAG: hypothetical protein A2W92_11110 [Bacteroidetes bacterium GWA2_42_15]OFX98987.1 MAG: hypothetical protein A2W89_06530 [Bacteroidetes bacterium GWE2_42_39]OFY46056.1 MAG: hypothetical protein A2W90_14945 [Bacteroidetes bacterium GWF2_42_66]HBL77224.1 hypothetical protein [Prolixibacteraceae bacterium]HCR90071.1 hypothetical protein [Prolixibacteraceae bacterium]